MYVGTTNNHFGLPGSFVLIVYSCMSVRLTTKLGYPVHLFYLFIHVCCYDLQLNWATRFICFFCLFVYVGTTNNHFGLPSSFVLFVYLCMLVRLTTNLGYPVYLLYLFICVCCYDLQLLWATRLICFNCLFVYVGATYNQFGLPG